MACICDGMHATAAASAALPRSEVSGTGYQIVTIICAMTASLCPIEHLHESDDHGFTS